MAQLDANLLAVIRYAYENLMHVSGDYARKNAQHVARAASMGLISTKVCDDVYCSEWVPTVEGLIFLEQNGYDVQTSDYSEAPIGHA